VTNDPRHLIRVGEMLPRLALTGADGAAAPPLPATQASLLVLVHPGCPECTTYLREVAEVVDDLRSWATRVLGVGTAAAPDPHLPFPLLGDEGGATRDRLGVGEGEAAVVLVDRWGEVFEAAAFGDDHGFPPAGQLVESAKIVDLSCGECNVPSPEWLAHDQ